MFRCVIGVIFFFLGFSLLGQDTVSVIVVSNLADQPAKKMIDIVDSTIEASTHENLYLLGLGDFISPKNGAYLNSFDHQSILLKLAEWTKKVKEPFLLSGDRDWDDSGYNGLEKMKDLDRYFQDTLKIEKGLRLDEGCPGPILKKLSPYSVLILINSQWFIHPYDKPISSDNDCDLFNEEDFWEELEDMVEDESDKRIVIAAHHTVLGNGNYSGNKKYKERWTIIGHFIADYKKNIGRSKDFSNPAYNRFRVRMQNFLQNYCNVTYVSGHENTLEILDQGNNLFINAGSMAKAVIPSSDPSQLYSGTENELLAISIAENKDLVVTIMAGNETKKLLNFPWVSPDKKIQKLSITVPDFGIYRAGPEYRASNFKKFWMGEHYREEWITPVAAPKLWLDSLYGGLTPYAKGGGLQTASLKLKDINGKKYAFRSIDKMPEKSLDGQVSQTIYRDLVKDLISTQHPYGSMVAASLLDQTDILHTTPHLFYLPDQEQLGQFRKEFGGLLGTLELRPSTKGKETFYGAKNILSTHQMYRNLINKDDHIIDKKAYAKARVFDMWVGDWDRHQDNWKWAAYKENKITIYRPIPRDRDHVFSQWEGVIPTIADFIIPNAEHFDHKFKNVGHLNWKARHLDRFLGSELTEADWLEAVQYIQSMMSPAVVENALKELPEEVEKISGQEIKDKLISRLEDLPRAVSKFYRQLAHEVTIVGSNKKDKFDITSDPEGKVYVRIFDGDKKTYERYFNPDLTKRIYIFGLGKKDHIDLNFDYPSSLKIRVIGGKGQDKIHDKTPQIFKDIKVYDYRKEDELEGRIQYIDSHQDPEFKVDEFEYPAILPFIGFKNSSGNGFGIQATFVRKERLFNKPGFAKITDYELLFYPGLKAYLGRIKYDYKYIWKKNDLKSDILFSTYFSDYPFYYGTGNNSIRNLELYEHGFYRMSYTTLKSKLGLSRDFWQQSSIGLYGNYEYNEVSSLSDQATLLNSLENNTFGLGAIHNLGIGMNLKLDFRDNFQFTRHGSLMELTTNTYFNKLSSFTKIRAHLAKYTTYNIFSPTTFILAAGISHTMGDAPFYMQSTLGSNTNLRGYVRNRFVDRSAFYYNTELRIHLGTQTTIVAPIRYGTFVFHDSGKVFDGKLIIDNMNPTFGGGLYFAPLADDYSFRLTIANSRDQNTYFRIDFGWIL